MAAESASPPYEDLVPPPTIGPDLADQELPSYTVRSQEEFVQQEHQLEDSKGRPWIWLRVKSRAKEGKGLPLFYSRDTIAGEVEVDFDKAGGAKNVVVSLLAGVTAVGQEEIRFLDINSVLWSKTASSKTTGKQKWPFSITLPADTTVSERGKKQQAHIYPLPPSFSERASPAYIDYRLVVTVKRSSFRVNQTLTTNFAYVPLTRAQPPSALRQLAYREGSPLVGPEGDPEGWKVLPSVKVAGTVFDARKVELECTLAVATPLTFPLGSPIPLTLTVKGSDEQALDLLATPSAIRVVLSRFRLVGSHAISEDIEGGRSNNSFTDVCGSAFFWPSVEGAPEPGTRVLQGELEVKKSLKIGFVYPRFSVRYVLALLQLQAPGWAPASPSGSSGSSSSSSAKEPLVSHPVTLVSVNAAGVVPRSYAPPGYAEKHEADYNTTVGYLENGNQRFLHHHGFA
ncbi:hypothetical protein L227DRAFT_575968 [Lentinus tigrinus ALCF2SS1-6]|uniref:Arrestin-like N-terminal domain-containing protein n=1 Tax=Lentinus tigrinus ALCF2SS1-6 TaxID=1328759 RepID=A0A5C2S8B0_9APHY|nr:hypothetical protein L227DRAFT_575968 [Lentinus tigrinus ALCF2SS1-6]